MEKPPVKSEGILAGMKAEHEDVLIDYKRDGKHIFRERQRKTKITEFEEPCDMPLNISIFIFFENNVVAQIGFTKDGFPGHRITYDGLIHFSGGRSKEDGKNTFFYHIALPEEDYFEYLEITEGKKSSLREWNIKTLKRGHSGLLKMG